ncbi:MAG: hypothetical protein ACYCOU_24900 [Sulfobacillus sp.]
MNNLYAMTLFSRENVSEVVIAESGHRMQAASFPEAHIRRYSPAELDRLNRPDLFSPEVNEFFRKLNLSIVDDKYPNGYNRSFHPKGSGHEFKRNGSRADRQAERKPLFKISEDPLEKLLVEVRKLLGKVSDKNSDAISSQLSQLSQFCTPESDDRLAELLYQTAMDCAFLIPVYLPLYLEFLSQSAFEKFMSISDRDFHQPREFADTDCEEGMHHCKRWFLSNSILINEMHKFGKVTEEQMREKVLALMHWACDQDSTPPSPNERRRRLAAEVYLEALAKILTPTSFPWVEHQIDALSKNQKIPARMRFMSMDILDAQRKHAQERGCPQLARPAPMPSGSFDRKPEISTTESAGTRSAISEKWVRGACKKPPTESDSRQTENRLRTQTARPYVSVQLHMGSGQGQPSAIDGDFVPVGKKKASKIRAVPAHGPRSARTDSDSGFVAQRKGRESRFLSLD